MNSYWNQSSDINNFNLVSLTGKNKKQIITKLSLKERRYISHGTLCMNYTPNEIYNNTLKYIYKILNYKALKIYLYFRNYRIRYDNKLNNCYKRLHFNKKFNDIYICDDLIIKIFSKLKILK